MQGFVLSRMQARHGASALVAAVLVVALLFASLVGCSGSGNGNSNSAKKQQVSLTSKSASVRFNDKKVYAGYEVKAKKGKKAKTVRVVEVFFMKHKSKPDKVYLRARNLTDKSGTITLWTTVGNKSPVKWDPEKLPSKQYVDIGPVTVPAGACLDVRYEFDQNGEKKRKSKGGSNVVCMEKSKNSKRS